MNNKIQQSLWLTIKVKAEKIKAVVQAHDEVLF